MVAACIWLLPRPPRAKHDPEYYAPRTWDSHFIGLPVVNPKKQNRPTRTAKEIEKINDQKYRDGRLSLADKEQSHYARADAEMDTTEGDEGGER